MEQHKPTEPLEKMASSPVINLGLESERDIQSRIEAYAQNANFAWVVRTLQDQREVILDRWLDAAADQPFHKGRREHAVADSIPALLDALIRLLETTSPRWMDPTSPLDDPAVLGAASEHAYMRVVQGLNAYDVIVEFRLLRIEIWRALKVGIPDSAPTGDVLSAELIVNDAIDGAISLGLSALTERVEQLREEFVATTVHEVRQPMTVVSGAAQIGERLLREENLNLERLRSTMQTIRKAVDRTNIMLNNLVDTSRIALGSLVLQPTDVNLLDTVKKVLSDTEPQITGRVKLIVDAGTDLFGWWDPQRLEQVWTNLLSNAAKYSPPDAPIDIRVSGDRDSVRMEVRDYGIGIAPEELTRLFGRYVRTRDATERGIEGLGLGLYLCRGIVEAHSGRLWAESQGLNTGTTFSVVLPRRDQ